MGEASRRLIRRAAGQALWLNVGDSPSGSAYLYNLSRLWDRRYDGLDRHATSPSSLSARPHLNLPKFDIGRGTVMTFRALTGESARCPEPKRPRVGGLLERCGRLCVGVVHIVIDDLHGHAGVRVDDLAHHAADLQEK